MDLATLCTFVASLRVVPNRLQFFQYETVSLSCDQTSASQWTILRNTSKNTNQKNQHQDKSSWFFNENIYYKDSGVYWCQSEEGECGAAVNITVTGGDIILESPRLPVMEGERVTLQCITNPESTLPSKGTFEFFKDGLWIGNSTSGGLTLGPVSVEDSGLYMCRCGEELSAESRLEVVKAEGRPPRSPEGATPNAPLTKAFVAVIIALPATAASLALLCLALLCVRRKSKEREKPEVNYSHVTVVQTPEPRRLKDLQTEDESTFYSTLQLNFMQ